MNRIWRRLAIATNWPVLVAVGVLSGVGAISVWADSPRDGKRQLVFLGAALVCMGAFQAVNYQKIGRWAWGFYLLSLGLIFYTIVEPLTGVKVPGVGEVNKIYAWINFGWASLQPTELMKIGFILVLARYLRFGSSYRRFTGLLPPFLLAVVPLCLIMVQPDLGTGLIFIPTLFAMLFVAGAKIKHLAAIVGIAAALAPVAWVAGPVERGGWGYPVLRHLPALVQKYQRERVRALLSSNPQMLQDQKLQPKIAMAALGSGGLWGKGLGNIPVGRGLPEGHNDMVFALIGEQFGFIGAAIVVGAYLVLFSAGIEIAAATREPFGRLIALGIVAQLAGQTFLNLLVTVRLMPVTGVTLPFVSYGGSSLVASFMAAGLLLNVGQNRPLVMARDAFEFE